jgi:hypothetical protein
VYCFRNYFAKGKFVKASELPTSVLERHWYKERADVAKELFHLLVNSVEVGVPGNFCTSEKDKKLA